MGKHLKVSAAAFVCGAALWFLPAPWGLLPSLVCGAYWTLEWFWQPNRAFAALGAQFLEAQREESATRAEAVARECLAQAHRARAQRPRLICLALDMLTTALMAAGKLEEAEAAAGQLVEAYPQAMLSPAELRPPTRTLAHVLMRRQKIDEAEVLLRKLQDSIYFREFPLQRGAVLSDLAALEAERGRPSRAAEWNTRAIHLLESHSAPERDLAVLYMNRGGNYAHHGDQSSALADYQKAVFLHERFGPDSTTMALLLSNAGVAELDLGQVESAVKTLRRSVDCWQGVATPWDPRFAMTCHNLAHALAALGCWGEAAAYAERSLEVKGGLSHPDYPTFHQALTAILAAQGRTSSAADGLPRSPASWAEPILPAR